MMGYKQVPVIGDQPHIPQVAIRWTGGQLSSRLPPQESWQRLLVQERQPQFSIQMIQKVLDLWEGLCVRMGFSIQISAIYAKS